MYDKTIVSIVNGILRSNYDSGIATLSGIALWLCRKVKPTVKDYYSRDKFDYESLFADGEDAAQRIEKHTSHVQLEILENNFLRTAEALLLFIYGYGVTPKADTLPVSEALSYFLFSFLNPKDGSMVYNPFGGDFYAPGRNLQVFFSSGMMDTNTIRFSRLYQVAKNRGNSIYYDFNPFLYPGEESQHYNTIYIPAMPFGIKIPEYGERLEESFLLNTLDMLSPRGEMVFVLPASSIMSQQYQKMRKTLLERRILRRVILLPQNQHNPVSNLQTAAFVVENTAVDDPHFYIHDLSKLPLESITDAQDLCHKVFAKDAAVTYSVEFTAPLASQSFQILIPSASAKRTDRPGFKYIRLGDLLAPYSRTEALDGTRLVARMSGKDLHLRLPEYIIGFQDIDLTMAQGRMNRIEEPVLCFHGITQNYAWCVADPEHPVYCNGDIYAYKISSHSITPEYLCFVLAEEDVKADIQSRIARSGLPRISRQSLMDVCIPVPDTDRTDIIAERLQMFVSRIKSSLAAQEKRAHEATLEDINEDIEDKIHLLAPYNSKVQLGINRVIKLLQSGEPLKADAKVYKNSDILLLDFLKVLLVKSQNVGYITASIGGSIFEEAKQPLDLFSFIQQYMAMLNADNEFADISFDITPVKNPAYIMITERSLRFVLDTIVRNAISHGFSEPFSGTKRIRFTIDADPSFKHAVISVANNGHPVADGFTQTLYQSKGGKCGPTSHTGRGGFFVSRAMAFYNGYVVVNTSNEQWPFEVLLHIPMSYE